MRYSFPTLSNLKNINYPIFFISIIIAIGAWYTISIGNRTDVYMRVLLDYQNVPEKIVVVEGLIPHIDVQIRGPKTLLTSQHSKNPSIVVDLAKLRTGKNVIPFPKETWGNQYRAFEVLEIEPTHLVIQAASIQERSLAIVPRLDVALNNAAFKVVDVNLSPSTALVSGPQHTVQNMKRVDLDIRIDPKEKAGTYTKAFPLVVPEKFTSVTPQSVNVTYTVASKRSKVKLDKTIAINGPQNNFTVDPKEVQFEVELPEGLLKNKKYQAQAKVQVTPPLLEVGQSAPVSLQFIMPEGMSLTNDTPRTIVITRVQ